MHSTFRDLFFSLGVLLFAVHAFPQNFAPPVNYLTDTFPHAVVQGDFDHDGNLDLIVVNEQSNTLDVFLGHGDGTFSRASTVSLSPNAPVGLAAADFDGDGNLDLVVTFDLADPQILFGNGDGTFRSPVTIPLPSPFHGVQGNGFRIVAADFNGDGHPDIALTGSVLGILIFLNNGDGTFSFSTQGSINTPSGVGDLAVGDFNNDGHLDIAFAANDGTVTSNGGSILLSLGNGDGTFQPPITLTTSQGLTIGGIAAADFNGDGRLDLIYTSGSLIFPGGALQVLLQQADGSFVASAPTAVSQTLSRIIAADFNGDLDQDVAVLQSSLVFPGSNTPNQVLIFHGNGDGTFAAPTIFDLPNGNNPSVLGPIDLLASSFTRTGALDLAVVDSGPNEISVLVNQGANTLTLSSSNNPSSLAAPVTLTATVQPKFPGSGTLSGSVIFADGNKTLGTAPVNSAGLSALSTSFNTPGNHPLLAVFSGNSSFVGGSSASLTQVVNKARPPVALTSSKSPSSFGEAVQFTATVSAVGAGVTPTGSLNLMNGASIIANGTLDNAGRVLLVLSSLPVGADTLIAQYAGDANYSNASSPPLVQTVNKSSTSTALDLNPNPSVFGQSVTLSATVAASGGGSGMPSGTVSFNDGDAIVGTAALDGGGKASLTLSSLAVGSHGIKASYPGDGNFLASTSPAAAQAVNKSPTTATLTTSPNLSVFGQVVTLSVSVVASGGGSGVPSGTVTFQDGARTLGLAILDGSGKASLTLSSLSVGSHSITASYSGDNNFLAAASAPVSQTVTKSPTTTTLTAAPNPSMFGQNVVLSVSVTASGGGAGIPSGTISFSDGSTTLGTVALDSAGKASLGLSSLGVGMHILAAAYGGDNNFTSSSATGAGGVTQVVNRSTTTTTLSSSSNPSVFGQAVTLTAAVVASGGGAGIPPGAINFSEAGIPLASVALDNTGRASVTLTSLALGSHSLSASYAGNSSFLASSSTPLSQFVNKDSVLMSLNSAPNPSTYRESVTFTLQVSAAPPGGSSGTPIPTGTVTLTEGASVLGVATLDLSGKTSFVLGNLTTGVHSIGATYGGDTNFTNGLLSNHPQEVDKAPTQTTLSSSLNPVTNVSSITLSARVTSGGGIPSGNEVFLDGTTQLAAVPLDGSGSALLPLSNLSIGNHNFTAVYRGDGNFATASSPVVKETVVDSHSSVKLSSSANPQTVTEAVTFVASVVPALGGIATGGTVTFMDGQQPLGTIPLVNSGASITTNALAVDDHNITAVYQAGAIPGPFDGVSLPLVETINAASPIGIIGGNSQDFTIAIQQPSSQIRAGDTFTTDVVLTPVNGLTGAIATLCAGVPEGATCTVTPDIATLDGKTPISATLSIATTAPTTVSTASPLGGSGVSASLLPLGLVPLGLCLCSASVGKRKSRLFVLMLLAGLLAGCGGTTFVRKPLPANTPPGTYTITVQSQSGSVAHSGQIILAVK
jgi:hypothetical protein